MKHDIAVADTSGPRAPARLARWLAALDAQPVAASRALIAAWIVTRLVLVVAMLVGHSFCDPAFYQYAGDFATGKLPYRDISVEYPPLTMVLILLPALPLLAFPSAAPRPIPHFHELAYLPVPPLARYAPYGISFACEMLVLDGLTLWLVRYSAARLVPSDTSGIRSGLLYVLLGFASGALLQKFDLVLGTLCLLAVVALLAGRVRTAWSSIALAGLVKGFPVLALPALVAFSALRGWRGKSAIAQLTYANWPSLLGGIERRIPGAHGVLHALRARRSELRAGALAFMGTLAVATGAVVLFAGWNAVVSTLLYHTARGTELESLYANIQVLLGGLPGLAARTVYSPSDLSRIVHSALDPLVPVTSVLVLGALVALAYVGLWLATTRMLAAREPTRLAAVGQLALTSIAATLLAFEISFRALPSHYLLVLVPLASVMRLPSARLQRVFIGSALVVALCGQIIAAPWVWNNVRDMVPWAILLLSLRNIAWVLAFGALVVALWQWPATQQEAPAWEQWL